MANFFRLTLLIIFFTLPSLSKADYTGTTNYSDQPNQSFYATPLAYCHATYDHFGYTVVAYQYTPTIYGCQRSPDGYEFGGVNAYYMCGKVAQNGPTCSGDPPAPPVTCSSDFTSPTVRSYTLDAGVDTKALQPSDIPAQSCIAGCAWQTQGAYSTFTLPDGSKHIEIGTRPTGVACSTTDAQPAQVSTLSDTKKDCLSKGNSFGQINGIDICLKSGTPSSATVGAKSDVKSKSSINGVSQGDSSSSSASTVNGDGSVTTNITNNINNPDGSTTKKQDSKTEDKQTFCQENPTSKICLDDKKSTFTGACPQSTCDGDAIQCAIAKRQQQDACDALTSKDLITALPAYSAGQELLQGKFSSDVQGFIDGTDGTTKTVNLTTDLSESGKANFTGEGMTDITFTVMGITRTLPLSNYNKYLQYMGYILLALAYVSALKIVMGSVA